MENIRHSGIVDQFQNAFATVFEDQINQLIRDSRREAMAQAKQILRESALNNVLEAVVDGTKDRKAKVAEATSSEVTISEIVSSKVISREPVQTARKKERSGPALVSRESRNAPPALNDRILEEIEAIREQIRRNEVLLSQIKPFVQKSKAKEE